MKKIQDFLYINIERDRTEKDTGLYTVDAAFNRFFRELDNFKQPDLTFLLSDVNEIIQNADFVKNELKTIGSRFSELFKSSQPENIDILNIALPFKMHLNKVRTLINKINLLISYNINFIKQSIRIKSIFKENQLTLLEKKNAYFLMLRDFTSKIIKDRENTRNTKFKDLIEAKKSDKNFATTYNLFIQYEELPYNIMYAVENILYFSNIVMVDVISDISQFLEIIMNLKLSGESENNLIRINDCSIFTKESDCNVWHDDSFDRIKINTLSSINYDSIDEKFEKAKDIITVNNSLEFLLGNIYNILNSIPAKEMEKYGNDIPKKKRYKGTISNIFCIIFHFHIS